MLKFCPLESNCWCSRPLITIMKVYEYFAIYPSGSDCGSILSYFQTQMRTLLILAWQFICPRIWIMLLRSPCLKSLFWKVCNDSNCFFYLFWSFFFFFCALFNILSLCSAEERLTMMCLGVFLDQICRFTSLPIFCFSLSPQCLVSSLFKFA